MIVVKKAAFKQELVYATRKEYADRHRVSIRTVDNWIKAGAIPYRRYGRKCIRIVVAQADKALEHFNVGV
jgi:predicted site-specific integrase-resolvase